ncbi:MAG TPA: tryptophan--tRNA ligase [Candidatus Paceibacterota bacterium]|jgi:tryptophanyl-tRNA synthetase|nr:tryptophan--tRNA ligase [Candidatus Paceibacterota bacterium]
MTEGKKRLFTGFQASGTLHIGNYFGAVKPNVELFKDHEGFFMIADYHALTSVKDSTILRANILDNAKDYLASGLDLKNATLFQQSSVHEHTELAWIFNCLVTVPFLMQGHAYKDKVARGLEANAGLFTYPMLMAADILLYDSDIVPVGEDQRQHIEYAREAAAKFNTAYGKTFKEPEELIGKAVGVVPGTDGQKMSKSYKNTIPLFGTKDEISKAVMSIVTDSGADRPENVYAIHKLFKTETEITPLYEANKGKYKVLKDALVEDIETMIAPMRERRANITDNDVKQVLADGAVKAKAIASKKMEDVRQKVGVSL